MKFIELFAGIGGFRYGLQKAKAQFQCVWANEWNKYAAQIYERNFSEKPDTRDIATVPTEEIPDHDLLVAGFPCQAFSIAGKRLGFDDTRGTLFFEIARILRDKRPRYFLLENVKGLLSHDGGKTIQTIFKVLSDIGYDFEWQVLNSKNFGVPQNRERIFIVGHLRGERRPKVFPIEGNDRLVVEEGGRLQDTQTAVALRATDYKGTHNMIQVVGGSQGYRVYDPSGLSSTLAGEAGGIGAKTGLYAIPVLTPSRAQKRQNGRRFKEDGDPAFTLTGQDLHGIYDGARIRRLTPTECERLQAFPDGWTAKGINEKGEEVIISDTQRYKVLGNAVTTSVVTAIANKLIPNQKIDVPTIKL